MEGERERQGTSRCRAESKNAWTTLLAKRGRKIFPWVLAPETLD